MYSSLIYCILTISLKRLETYITYLRAGSFFCSFTAEKKSPFVFDNEYDFLFGVLQTCL